MRRAIILCVLLAASAVAFAAQKEKPVASAMKKGDTIAVKGCLTGGALEATDLAHQDSTGELSTGITFRLTGEKTLLKQMRDKHDGKIVEVEGVLKSDLPQQTVQSHKIGKMRVRIGAPSARPGSPDAEARRSVPVLEVKSFDGSTTTCGR
jgi:hypothetical protein